MTVEQLIAELQKHDPKMRVIVDRYSDFGEVRTVHTIVGVERGGYVSDMRYGEPSRACGWVHITDMEITPGDA